jgi:hypothetical protein
MQEASELSASDINDDFVAAPLEVGPTFFYSRLIEMLPNRC